MSILVCNLLFSHSLKLGGVKLSSFELVSYRLLFILIYKIMDDYLDLLKCSTKTFTNHKTYLATVTKHNTYLTTVTKHSTYLTTFTNLNTYLAPFTNHNTYLTTVTKHNTYPSNGYQT